MGLIPPSEKELDMPEIDQNLWACMERLLNEHLFTYYMLSKEEKQNIRRGFLIGHSFARAGYKSMEVK